jgi:hypothetical protein
MTETCAYNSVDLFSAKKFLKNQGNFLRLVTTSSREFFSRHGNTGRAARAE